MSDKPMTLEELARAEAQALKNREKLRLAFAEAQKKLVTVMPDRFLAIARQVRDGVRRYNEVAYKEGGPEQRVVSYDESVAVTTRDPNLGSEFNLEIRRAPNKLSLVLRSMWRPNRPDTYIISGKGTLGIAPNAAPFEIRIDGLNKIDGEIYFRTVCNTMPVDTPIDELPDRLVMVVVTGQLSRLWIRPPWSDVSARPIF
jgi:hypothetical protein